MGATSFVTTVRGATPHDAFSSAVNEALYLHGHGGYTGTIAEKSGFTMCPIPSTIEFRFWARSGNELEVALGTIGPKSQWRTDCVGETAAELRRFAKEYDEGAPEWTQCETVWETRAYKAVRDLLLFGTPQQVIDTHRVWNDKWGNALCVPVAEATYMFMGYASC